MLWLKVVAGSAVMVILAMELAKCYFHVADQLVFKAIQEIKFKVLQQHFIAKINQLPKVESYASFKWASIPRRNSIPVTHFVRTDASLDDFWCIVKFTYHLHACSFLLIS